MPTLFLHQYINAREKSADRKYGEMERSQIELITPTIAAKIRKVKTFFLAFDGLAVARKFSF